MEIVRSRVLSTVVACLAALGALNWGLAGLFRWNLLSWVWGRSRTAEKVTYGIVASAGFWLGIAQIVPRVLLALQVRSWDPMQALAARSLVGRMMPSVTGSTLGGKTVAIPRDTLGKVAFLVMGFSYDSRFDVEDWLRAFQERFGQDPDVVAYEMAMIDAPYRLFGAAINEGMRRASPPESHDRVVTVYASQRPLRQSLRAASTSGTWVYLLDPEGKVLFQGGGTYDAERFQELAWVADSAVARAKAPVPEYALK